MDIASFFNFIRNLTLSQRLTIVGLFLGSLTLIAMLISFLLQPRYALLYSDLGAASAGEIMAALDQRGERYRVSGTGIFVDQSKRDELRMSLAATGLPRNPTKGYEILEELPQFGTTSQMFGAALLRAREGELAKSISSMPNVLWARVHLSMPKDIRAKDNQRKASVTLGTRSAKIDLKDADAIRHLVASAVPNLDVEHVVIIADGKHILEAGDGGSGLLGDSAIEESLRSRISRLLEARVGAGNAIVEVRVETSKSQEQIVERIVDPDTQVAVSTQVEEISQNRSASQKNDVTVASDLPQPDTGGNNSDSENKTETRETTNYDFTEIHREITKAAGTIERISVAALVNSDAFSASGGSFSAEELTNLRELIASAVGFNLDRGDVVTIKSLPFLPLPEAQEEGGLLQGLLFAAPISRILEIIFVSATLLIAIILLKKQVGQAVAQLPEPQTQMVAPSTAAMPNSANGQDSKHVSGEVMPDVDPTPHASLSPTDRMKSLIEERRHETLEVLKLWLDENRRAT